MATTCKHKMGLLSLRDCDEPAVAKCKMCGRPVCQEHQRTVQLKKQRKVLCVECYLELKKQRGMQDDSYEYRRHSMYRSSGYHPYYYGSSRRFGHDHYHYFDREREPEIEAEEEMDAADFQDS